jgi:hypothetical protein
MPTLENLQVYIWIRARPPVSGAVYGCNCTLTARPTEKIVLVFLIMLLTGYLASSH